MLTPGPLSSPGLRWRLPRQRFPGSRNRRARKLRARLLLRCFACPSRPLTNQGRWAQPKARPKGGISGLGCLGGSRASGWESVHDLSSNSIDPALTLSQSPSAPFFSFSRGKKDIDEEAFEFGGRGWERKLNWILRLAVFEDHAKEHTWLLFLPLKFILKKLVSLELKTYWVSTIYGTLQDIQRWMIYIFVLKEFFI